MMIKRLLLLMIIGIQSVVCYAQPAAKDGIEFQPLNLEQAIAKAKAEKKFIFLHGYATWCHFCEYMRDSVYTDKAAGSFYNRNFICIHLDMEKEGLELNKRLKIRNYPTYVFFDSTGTLVHRVAGQKSITEFLKIGADALDSNKQFRHYEQIYRSGKANAADAGQYLAMVNQAGLDNQSLVSSYLLSIPDSDFVERPYWKILNDLYRDAEQPLMRRFLEFRDAFVSRYSADSVDNRILNNYNATLMIHVQRLDTLGYREMLRKISDMHLAIGSKIIGYAELNRMKMSSDWNNYFKAAVPFVDSLCANDYRRLNEIAFNFSERATDPALLKKAESWAYTAVRLNDSYRNNHTLASILFKENEDAKALSIATHAIELARKSGIDYNQTAYLLSKISERK